MTREGTRPFAAFIVALLVAALLAACGGSDSDSSSSSTAATTTGSSAANGSAASDDSGSQDSSQARQDGGQAQGNSAEGDQSQSRQSPDGGSGSQDVAAPLKVSGGGSDQFRVEGGDNSVQEYGEESDESELQEAAEIVHSFYVARAEEKWDTACSYLSKSNIAQLEQLSAQSPQLKDAGCAPILRAFTRPLSASIDREITTVDAGSLRRDGEQGFLIYYGAGHTVYAMPLADEGGTWKVAALSGSALG